MKRFFAAIALCCSLLVLGSYLFLPSAGAQNDPMPALLSFPAPPPPNPFYKPSLSARDENFFDRRNPPPDDAPTEDLLAYWKNQNGIDDKFTFAPRPSEKSLERLIDQIEEKPALLAELVNLFPENRSAAEFVKGLYDAEMRNKKFDSNWRESVKRWLTYHSNFYSDELFRMASQAADSREYVTNQDEVLAITRVDFERAKPLLERMLANSQQPISQTLARWALYKRALADGDSLSADTYRRQLQETVENKEMKPGNRDLAMDAIVAGGDYPGRDDWYFSLLDDETLFDLRVNGQVYTGLTTLINHSSPERYVEKMVGLAGSSNQNIRNVAARNLVAILDQGSKDPEVVRALTPWLEDPKWAREVQGERRKVVAALRLHQIPESVAGLIAMLNEKDGGDRPNPNANRNEKDFYPYRSEAVGALIKQESPLAASSLRQLLPVVEDWERENIVRAVLVSNGFAVREQVEALEFIARANKASLAAVNAAPDAAANLMISVDRYDINPANVASNVARTRTFDGDALKGMLGNQLVNLETPGNDLVKAVLDRIEFQDKRDPQLAAALRAVIKRWKGPAINSLMLGDLKNGRADAGTIVRLLAIRKELREKQLDELNGIRGANPTALGISACLLEQNAEYDAILEGENVAAKIAVLACARLIRGPIAVQRVAPLLNGPNKLLALAAERYLEAEDSQEARGMILTRHPGEMLVLGARAAFTTGGSFADDDGVAVTQALFASVNELFAKFPPYQIRNASVENDHSSDLRDEFKTDPKLLGVYSYDDNFVRIYADRAVFSWQDDPARYRERDLAPEEFEALKNYLANQRVDEMPPFLSACDECEAKELLMLGRAGGRRVFVMADPLPTFFGGLSAMFEEFRRQPARYRYYFEREVSGLEVLFADDNLAVETVWKNGTDLRLLINDQSMRKRIEAEQETETENSREESDDEDGDEDEDAPRIVTVPRKADAESIRRQREREFGSFSWMSFVNGKLTEPVTQPPGVEFMPLIDAFAVQPTTRQWRARGNGVEVRADEEGLYKLTGGRMTKILSGRYVNPVVTPNGRWAVATKFILTADEDIQISAVRVNLQTNKEFKIPLEAEYGPLSAVCYIASLNRILLYSGYIDGESDEGGGDGESFLLDPETGTALPTNGNIGPLLQQSFRPLQPVAGYPDFFWAAVSEGDGEATEFGIFHAKTLTFRTMVRLSKVNFDSMSLWVDEPGAKFYLAYGGHLLSLPLPKMK